jgi:hypothetical protein
VREYLERDKGYDSAKLYTSDAQTSHVSIVRKMYNLALSSWREGLAEACIYYSGHGGSTMGDLLEADGMDEFLVPTDYARSGVIRDNKIKKILRWFNPRTRVVVIVDACHSGTMCDLKYTFDGCESIPGPARYRCRANVVSVSGCRDEQCSYEAWQGEVRGVMTTGLLLALREETTVGGVRRRIVEYAARGGYDQEPQVASSFDMDADYGLFL